MNVALPSRAPLAWLLLACLLLNGLVCALGHGRMLATHQPAVSLTAPAPAMRIEQAHGLHLHADYQAPAPHLEAAADLHDDMPGMHAAADASARERFSPTGDCAFAATLLLAVLLGLVLHWLLRPGDPHRRRYRGRPLASPRLYRCALHPQAP